MSPASKVPVAGAPADAREFPGHLYRTSLKIFFDNPISSLAKFLPATEMEEKKEEAGRDEQKRTRAWIVELTPFN